MPLKKFLKPFTKKERSNADGEAASPSLASSSNLEQPTNKAAPRRNFGFLRKEQKRTEGGTASSSSSSSSLSPALPGTEIPKGPTNQEQKDTERATTSPTTSPDSSGSPPKYPKAVADLQRENRVRVENAEPLPRAPEPLTAIEERNAWIAQHIRFSGPEHYDLILHALDTGDSPYNSLPKLRAVVQGSRASPTNGQVPFTVGEQQLTAHLELGGATPDLALWTVRGVRDALMQEWGPQYWAGEGYCCYEMVWRTSMGLYDQAQVAPCSVHGSFRGSSLETIVEEDEEDMGSGSPVESANTVDSVIAGPVVKEDEQVDEADIIGVRTLDGGIVI